MKSALLNILFLVSFSAFANVRPIDEIFEPAGQFDPDVFGKVAVLQWAPTGSAPINDETGAKRFKQNNIATLEAYIREAAANGAELVITPEFGIVGYPDIPELPPEDDNFRTREDIKFYVETLPGPSSQYFAALAKELAITIHFGLAEKDRETDAYYNAVAVVGPQGDLIASYRKQHLFEIEYDYLESGIGNTVYESQFGKVGIIICSDVYDYGVLARYRASGIDVIALSTSWTQYNTGMNYFRSGALRTNATMLASNHDYYPDSGVINPDGTFQSHIRQSTGLAYGYLRRK